ncbi:hypothetical protein QYE76_055640 [Lolium multiflorum]|uniref:Arabidopsis retrotransposon Orf1 C-terminal domain-containing protein n=1 Tax=Lolium multiflorum TaxID=4521 RepID=A0AAD8WMH3_LOLMU|nr:hypothetical protein QYE76_055640 [Lolium multiflorum]
MLTKIFVESFKFHNKQYGPTVAFKIYGNPITMELEEFCRALDIAPVGTARRIDDNPRDLLELYRGITDDDCRTIQRGKIRNIQLPAIKYFAYYIATSILGRENTSNISSYHLAFLNAALTGQTSYHLGSLIARRLSNRGPIFGGTIALRILTHLRLPLDSNDVPLTPRRLDITAMKSHHFVTADSTLDNMVYRMLFADGDEKEIPLPQPGLFSIDRQPWSRTKEEVEENMKIQDFHQQHDSEDAEPSYDYTVTYPGLLDDFFTLVNRAGLAAYVGDEREQYYMLTKIFVESFKFHNKQYGPTVAFKIYGNPITMELEEFCVALDIAPVDNLVYRMLFADGDEKEITLPQPDLFSIDREPWSRTKEEVEEKMKIQDFHQQHDSEDAEPSYDCTVTYPGASSSTYPEYDPSSSYYGDATSWPRWG